MEILLHQSKAADSEKENTMAIQGMGNTGYCGALCRPLHNLDKVGREHLSGQAGRIVGNGVFVKQSCLLLSRTAFFLNSPQSGLG
jgi:hypothetical protein